MVQKAFTVRAVLQRLQARYLICLAFVAAVTWAAFSLLHVNPLIAGFFLCIGRSSSCSEMGFGGIVCDFSGGDALPELFLPTSDSVAHDCRPTKLGGTSRISGDSHYS